MGRNRSAARVRSSSARSKNSASLDSRFANFLAIVASYAVLFLIAWAKIVGLEVSPVTDRSWMYCFSVPLSSRSRVMLSSQRLWPRLWRICVAFIVSPQLVPNCSLRYSVDWMGANDWCRSIVQLPAAQGCVRIPARSGSPYSASETWLHMVPAQSNCRLTFEESGRWKKSTRSLKPRAYGPQSERLALHPAVAVAPP